MATYVPNANQTTEPVESQTVESAALEFRTLKKHALQFLTADADASKTTLPSAVERAGKYLGFSSWIADNYPDELAMWAAAIVFARTGFAEMAADFQRTHVQPFKELLIASHLLANVN